MTTIAGKVLYTAKATRLGVGRGVPHSDGRLTSSCHRRGSGHGTNPEQIRRWLVGVLSGAMESPRPR